MIFLPLETELFYYEHLLDSSDNLQLIQDFCVTNTSGYGLERYIKELAESDEKDGSARTYLVKDRFTHEIVAYFSLLLMQVMITFIQFQELNLQILLLILRIEKIIQMLRI
ncbi:MAG: hypothetical protein KIG83_10460 [Treponema sp.]|nr:hypothetical protein [Treponema sp.]